MHCSNRPNPISLPETSAGFVQQTGHQRFCGVGAHSIAAVGIGIHLTSVDARRRVERDIALRRVDHRRPAGQRHVDSQSEIIFRPLNRQQVSIEDQGRIDLHDPRPLTGQLLDDAAQTLLGMTIPFGTDALLLPDHLEHPFDDHEMPDLSRRRALVIDDHHRPAQVP